MTHPSHQTGMLPQATPTSTAGCEQTLKAYTQCLLHSRHPAIVLVRGNLPKQLWESLLTLQPHTSRLQVHSGPLAHRKALLTSPTLNATTANIHVQPPARTMAGPCLASHSPLRLHTKYDAYEHGTGLTKAAAAKMGAPQYQQGAIQPFADNCMIHNNARAMAANL